MKKIFTLLLLFLLFLSCRSQVERDEEYAIYQTMIDIFSQAHFLQKNLNKDFYQQTFSNYLDIIDRSKVFFSQKDIAKLKKYMNPNESENNDLYNAYKESIGKIPDLSYEIYQQKLPRYREVALSLLGSPIDFDNEKDGFEAVAEKKSFQISDDQAIEQWMKSLKYDVLSRLLVATDGSNKSPSTIDYQSEEYKKKEKKAREDSLKATKIFLVSFETMKQRDYFNNYLKAVGESYDRYTTYQSPVEEETFNIGISGELEGIGAQIGKAEDGSVEIASVIPGGPAYKQKVLKVGDKILEVAQGKNGEFVNLIPLTLNRALTYIRGKKDTVVRLKVKRVEGETEVVEVVRGKVVLAETYVRSAVLKTVKGKLGYILVPKFYGNPDPSRDKRHDIRTVSDDVEYAINYLKKQGVKGLIVDLRNNAGGFLGDAIRMTRFFNGDNPVVRVKDRRNEVTLRDEYSDQIIYDDPVVVMINENSASASEIFSAALQDHKRAVIVGSKQSYGKATVQNLFKLTDHNYFRNLGGKYGAFKFTIQKYYRATGKSTQTEGVKSDVILPGLSMNPNFKKHSFPIDELEQMELNYWDKKKYDFDRLRSRSSKRLSKSKYFINVQERLDLITTYFNQTHSSLNYLKERKRRDDYLSKVSKFKVGDVDPSKYYEVAPNTEELKRLGKGKKSQEQLDADKASREEWVKGLKKDTHLEESIFILEDMLN